MRNATLAAFRLNFGEKKMIDFESKKYFLTAAVFSTSQKRAKKRFAAAILALLADILEPLELVFAFCRSDSQITEQQLSFSL